MEQLDFKQFVEQAMKLMNHDDHIAVDTCASAMAGNVIVIDEDGELALEWVEWTKVTECHHLYIQIDMGEEDELCEHHECDADELYHKLSLAALEDKNQLYSRYIDLTTHCGD